MDYKMQVVATFINNKLYAPFHVGVWIHSNWQNQRGSNKRKTENQHTWNTSVMLYTFCLLLFFFNWRGILKCFQ